MSTDSVKMGRIPKKLKEKALRAVKKHQQKKTDEYTIILPDDACISLNQMAESLSSTSSTRNSSSTSTQQSSDNSPDIIIIPPGK
jgi:hypothetical protein